MLRGLPLTYSKDMQEDKAPLFRAHEDLLLCLSAMRGMVIDMQPQMKAMESAANIGFSTATDVADWLVQTLNIPFRQAHHLTGAAVRMAEEKSCSLHQLSLADWQRVHPDIDEGLLQRLTVQQSVTSRQSYGGTAPSQVRIQLARWREQFAMAAE